MDLDMKQVLQMMGEMNASIQGLAVELRSSIKGLEGRFDGLEKRFDGLEGRFGGLERKFERLTMDYLRAHHDLRKDFRDHADEMKGLYNNTAWAMESARASAGKVLAHGPILADHEDRIRALEGKRKTRPAA